MKSYFNTNNESGRALKASIEVACNQQDMVLRWFRAHPGQLFAPHEVHVAAFGGSVPLTSVRRAISNLTDAGLLRKTPVMRPGTYGKHVHTWALETENSQKVAV